MCFGFCIAETASANAAETIPLWRGQIQQVCSAIYKGDFASARKQLGENDSKLTESAEVTWLRDIVSEYEAIGQRRSAARESAYTEQLAELEKSWADADTNDINDTNDVNDITKLLSVIAKVNEFADQKQKEQLLSNSSVKSVFQKAIEKAAELESKGKWLDAYISCYSWLERIDKNNQAYSDYAEQLLTKASIVASFQDSPCESSEERFRNVKKKMFIKAIDTLRFNYVSLIDYHQMAVKAVRRCELLTDILTAKQLDGHIVERSAASAWSAALAEILDKVNKSAVGFSKDKFIDVFKKVLASNKTTVELPQTLLIAQFAEAALSSLDPYTVMVWPRQVQDFEQIMTNEFTGIGIEISKPKGFLTVSSLLLDTPAFNCGIIDAGDVIEAVDGVETKDMTLMCAVKNIKGPAGTKVELRIRRPNRDKAVEDKIFDVTLVRAKITVPTIRGWQRTEKGKWLYMLDDINRTGYVRITSFSAETASDLEKVLVGLEAEGLEGLILDLRFNTGGLLSSAIEVTDKFIEEGLVVSTRPRFGVWTYVAAHKAKTHPNYPLVVLINRYSASASEIVAGALADAKHNRAILVGERTHGKGSVQGIARIGAKAQLKYTMAYYHLPSGQRVESKEAMKKQGRDDWGVGPELKVELRNDEFRKLREIQRDNDVLVKVGHDNHNAPLKKHTVEETLAVDPQLAVAVLIVKAKNIERKARLSAGL